MAVDARITELIKQKALAGQQMSAPTAEKQKIYDQFAVKAPPKPVVPKINTLTPVKPATTGAYNANPVNQNLKNPVTNNTYAQQGNNDLASIKQRMNALSKQSFDLMQQEVNKGYGIGVDFSKSTLAPIQRQYYELEDQWNKHHGNNSVMSGESSNYSLYGLDRDSLGMNSVDTNGFRRHNSAQEYEAENRLRQQGYSAQQAYEQVRGIDKNVAYSPTNQFNDKNAMFKYSPQNQLNKRGDEPMVKLASMNAPMQTRTTMNTPVPKPSYKGISDYEMNEIKRKALSGQGLSSPTTEKKSVYDYYRSNPSASGAKGINTNQINEIIRKAEAGIRLDQPTAEKMAIYNSFKKPSFDSDSYMKDMQSQVNSIYDQQKQSQMGQFHAERDKALGLVNQQKAEVAPQYASARNQSDVVNSQNVSKLRELMAANGISASGENVTANIALGSARQGALSQLNLQEQQTNNDFNRQITDINNPERLNAMISQLEAQRSEALYNASIRADDVGYSRGRDDIMDSRYAEGLQYEQKRDAIGDQRYNQQFNYQAGRDKVGDSQWNQQFNNGNQQWQQQFNQSKKQHADDVAWRKHTYNNMSASEKASMDRSASQFGEEMAWRMYSLEYQGELDRSTSEAQLEAYKNGNFNGGAGTGKNTLAEFGALSRKYESNGNPATIARTKGDLGGASYGSYQLTTSSGHAQKFANNYGGALKGLKAGTSAFDKAWKAEASKNPKAFNGAQHNYIQSNHYVPAANRFQSVTGIKLDTMPKAVKDMIWSIGVQHGAGGAATIFRNSGVKAGMNAASIISKVYNERMKVNKYFSSSPQSIKNGVLNRFRREMQDALNMLR